MAAGDAVVQLSASVANNSFLDLQPGAGVEWVIHNIYTVEGAAYELYWYDGTNSLKIDHDAAVGRYNLQLHCTNAKYVRIKNVSGVANHLGADGMVTK